MNEISALKKLILLNLLLFGASGLFAQDTTETRQEVWPEINLYYKINNKFRIFMMYSATKLKHSSYTDGGFGVYVDYFTIPFVRRALNPNLRDSTKVYNLWLRAGYLYSTTPPESADPFKENTLVTEANGMFHLPYHILLTNRHRFDWRILSGDFEPRYRIRFTFEKEMRTKYLYFTPNIYGEYYVYFNGGGLNRFRLSGGIQTKMTDHLEFEIYYLHQFDNGKNVNSLNAMGFTLKIYLKHKEMKKAFSKKKKEEPACQRVNISPMTRIR